MAIDVTNLANRRATDRGSQSLGLRLHAGLVAAEQLIEPNLADDIEHLAKLQRDQHRRALRDRQAVEPPAQRHTRA